MSQLGQKAKYSLRADVFRFAPDNGRDATTAACPFRAISGLMHGSKQRTYSITSSARPSNVGGTVKFMASGGWKQPVGLELGEGFGEHRLGIHHLGEAGLHQLDGGNNRRRTGLIAAIAHGVVGVFEGQAD